MVLGRRDFCIRLAYSRPVTEAIGYVRVSTDEQADSRLGLEAQRAAIVAEAEKRGWRLVEIVEDAAVSGRDLSRPGMAIVLRTLQSHRADTLVVAKLDRLGRSLLDVAGLIDQAARQGWALVALDLGVDTSTLTGKAMAGMMAVFAELERGMIGQRTRDALRAARARGTVLGRPRILSDDTLLRIATAWAAGSSLRAIARELNEERVPTAHGAAEWRVSSVQSALRSAARMKEAEEANG
jgi:DNA invertase Pin-like site-specific DNA recombinase